MAAPIAGSIGAGPYLRLEVLASTDHRQRLIETGHALADVTGKGKHDLQGRERFTFEVRIATPARSLIALT